MPRRLIIYICGVGWPRRAAPGPAVGSGGGAGGCEGRHGGSESRPGGGEYGTIGVEDHPVLHIVELKAEMEEAKADMADIMRPGPYHP
jgi:hypothetical protein